MNFRLRHPDLGLNHKIFHLVFHGSSNRHIARQLGLSEHCVRLRIRRLAQRAIEFHHLHTANLPIRETLCYDGLENFAGSQYNPNHINHIIGRDSLFIYDFSLANLNRKGRMSAWQRQRLEQIEQQYGRYNPKAIRLATAQLLRRIAPRCENIPLSLITDEHFQYKRALKYDLANISIHHLTISSKACRNFQNILFPVNHADLLVRQRLAAFARETISFAKTTARMCQRYVLFMTYKNYMQPQFTKKHIKRPLAHLHSPAQSLKLTNRLLCFNDIFSKRSLLPPKHLNHEWKAFYNDQIPPEQLRSTAFRRTKNKNCA